MPIFYHSERQQLLLTNFKVMYSTLKAQAPLQELFPGRRTFIRLLADQWRLRPLKKYLLVRHPEARIRSFFKDKFRQHPQDCLAQDFADFREWQHNQRIFFPALGLDVTTEHAVIAQALLNTSFEQFLQLLPGHYLKDPHLQPQVTVLEFRYPNYTFHFQPDGILKMETTSPETLQQTLGINPGIRKNKTQKTETLFISEQAKALLQDLYQADYQTFNYEA